MQRTLHTVNNILYTACTCRLLEYCGFIHIWCMCSLEMLLTNGSFLTNIQNALFGGVFSLSRVWEVVLIFTKPLGFNRPSHPS